MWTVLILLNLGALYCTVSSSTSPPPSPINVVFTSVNLRNLLQWSPGNGTLDDTHFTVQYAIYGDSVEGSRGRRVHWRAVRHCTEIVRTWCDLSNETGDLEHGYHAKVRAVSRRASSKWALTLRRFDPNLETTFGPPLVSVAVEGNNAIITLKGPMRYQPNNHTPVVSMATLYPQMSYNLSIHNTRHDRTSHIPVGHSPYKYSLMEHDTEYCFSAKTRFLSMPIHCQSSEWHCITTPADPVIGQLQRAVVGIVVPSVCMCMLVLVGYILYHYLTGKGQKSPYILNPPSFHPPLVTFPPETIILIKVGLLSDPECSLSDISHPKRQQDIADPPPTYAPQGSGTPPEPEEPWEDLSMDYGFVAAAPQTNARGEEEEQEGRHDRGEDGNNLQKCSARKCYEKKEDSRVEDRVHGPQAQSYLSQSSTRTCSQTHLPMHAQTEVSTLVHAHPFSQVNSQVPQLLFQGATKGEVDREFPGLFIERTPQTGLFHIPLNPQAETGGGMGEEVYGKERVRTDGRIDGGVEEGERAPLLSAYTSQNINHMPTSHADQSDLLPDDYGVLRLDTAHDIEEDDDDEDEGTICVDWDPNTRKLVFPEMAMEFSKEDGLMQGERRRENRTGGAEEEEYVMKGELRLENVFVRQGSEEKAQREMEKRGETGWEADDLLTKWNLVISMDP